MKKLFTLLFAMVFTVMAWTQAPQKMSYQAVIRDAGNKLVTNHNIGMRISILQTSATGTAVYTETQTAVSNANGLVTLEIGAGTTTDNFSAINWANGPYFIKTETDPTGGTNYTITGSSQLLSVPYALYAANSNSPKFVQLPLVIKNDSVEITKTGVVKGNMITYDGNNWVALDLDSNHPIVDEVRTAAPVSNMQPYLTVNYCISLFGIFPSRSGSNPFVGEIEMFGFNFAPVGWAMCNGQLLAISSNTALFSLLGTMYGGNGTSTFALPDLQGRVPIHMGQGSGLTNHNQGDSGGTETITIQYNDKHRQ
ncbi:MAG TPA: tail fiber protein [Bacteroidales bacterium]